MKSLINSHLYFRYMNSQIEFIELNLIIFCDRQTDRQTHTQTLWLIESLDLPDRETKNWKLYSIIKNIYCLRAHCNLYSVHVCSNLWCYWKPLIINRKWKSKNKIKFPINWENLD